MPDSQGMLPRAMLEPGVEKFKPPPDQGETARPQTVVVNCTHEPGGLFPHPALRATFSRPHPHSLSRGGRGRRAVARYARTLSPWEKESSCGLRPQVHGKAEGFSASGLP